MALNARVFTSMLGMKRLLACFAAEVAPKRASDEEATLRFFIDLSSILDAIFCFVVVFVAVLKDFCFINE